MSIFKYLKLTNSERLRFINFNSEKNLYVVFLHGFMSDLEGSKPKNFLQYCKKNNLGFLAIEYSGHGKSSGEFTKGNITKWTNEVKNTIKKIIKKKKFIIIGSSMGSWISLQQFKYFRKQICGFLGIASAPEFLDRLMWNRFSKKIKNEIIKKGISYINHGNFEYPITYQLIKDGKKNRILNKNIFLKIPVTMVHGTNDEVVPINFSKKVLSLFKNAQKKLVIIKKGDHSLSSKKNLKIINQELNYIISNKV